MKSISGLLSAESTSKLRSKAQGSQHLTMLLRMAGTQRRLHTMAAIGVISGTAHCLRATYIWKTLMRSRNLPFALLRLTLVLVWLYVCWQIGKRLIGAPL